MSRVYLASDHAGFALKSELVEYLSALGHETDDVGAHALDPDDDYPDFITPCADKVASDAGSFGIIIGKTGEGEAMCANRVPGVRAAVFYGGPSEILRLAREHNDANVLSFGAGFITIAEAKDAAKRFLETCFPGDVRHCRRIAKF